MVIATKGPAVRARLTSVAFLIGLLLVAFGVSACRPTGITVAGDDVVYCTIIADPPIDDANRIAAPGRYRCDGDGATSITITVTLQKLKPDGVNWSTVAHGTWTVKGENTTRLRSETTRTRKVYGRCATDGWYRTLVHAVEHSNGHSQTFDNHSVRVPHPCKSWLDN